MKTVNSISGGQTSAYIAANYKADVNLFSLVRTNDTSCMFPDAKLRQMVSDKIGTEFIGTLEDDIIIHTMFDLEQFIGSEITWVTGKSFEDLIRDKGGWLPNLMSRYCTTNMKLVPMFEWWYENVREPVETRIGFRANELNRADRMVAKTNEEGLSVIKATVSKHDSGKNKWQEFAWQKPAFPLINDQIYKDHIVKFWNGKPVRFAYMNNCVGCFHRNEILLNKMFELHPNKMEWFRKQENNQGGEGKGTWKKHITYDKIKNHKMQIELALEDFDECDSGHCGL